ncbi:MAG: heme lyase CcmF/NrfE family subunit [Actinomycetota bacterium]
MSSLAVLGRPALVAGLVFALLAMVLSVLGAIRRRRDLSEAGGRALTAAFGATALASLGLMHALFVHDFSFEYVTNYTSRSLSGPYTVSAFWGGMEGSLLFWTLLLTGFSSLAVHQARGKGSRLAAWSAAVLAGVSVFFLMLIVLPADPFSRLASVPSDGRGLNPLLQSPGMMIHPPLLYTGFVGFSIPFAFAMAAMLSGRLDEGWFTFTRRWTLFAWSALTVGIVLGGAWAYTELGWGGYWAWDPVENASFMPWLTATAYLHSVVIQEKRRMFKVWNVSLILMTYGLAIFGTFLTRSGILSSIHTFTEGPIGKWFLPFLALMLIGGLAVVAWRYDSLRGENRFDSMLSREFAFLANNVLFLAAGLAVLWGTIYPVIAELFTGIRLSVGPPFFNAVFVPIGLALVFLTGLGPLISWRRMSREAFLRVVRIPLIAGAITVGAFAVFGVRNLGTMLAFGLCVFTAVAIGAEFARGSRIYRNRGMGLVTALAETMARNRRRYGGYVIHLGIVLMVIGFAGSAFRSESERVLARGESLDVGAYTLTYETLRQEETPEKNVFEAEIDVTRGTSYVTTLRPQRNFHIAQEQPQSEVAIRTTPVEDLYAVVTSVDADGAIGLRAFVNPLTWWIWAGTVVMVLGMWAVMTGHLPVAVPAATRTVPLQPEVAEV